MSTPLALEGIMAILTFESGEGFLEAFGASGATLEYAQLFGPGHGWVAKGEAAHLIQRIRNIEVAEAGALVHFLMEGHVLSEFRSRMAPEDWDRLLEALPGPDDRAMH
jgi:hypothetical protein